jgi:hypothetical protein
MAFADDGGVEVIEWMCPVAEDEHWCERRRYRSGNPIRVVEPTLVPMTAEQRQRGIAALSRLFASLVSDEEFMWCVEARRAALGSGPDSGA